MSESGADAPGTFPRLEEEPELRSLLLKRCDEFVWQVKYGHGPSDEFLNALAEAPIVEEFQVEEKFRSRFYGPTLSKNQLAAVFLASHGIREGKAAEMLGIEPNRFKERLRAARIKLGGKNQTDTVAIAIRRGLIP